MLGASDGERQGASRRFGNGELDRCVTNTRLAPCGSRDCGRISNTPPRTAEGIVDSADSENGQHAGRYQRRYLRRTRKEFVSDKALAVGSSVQENRRLAPCRSHWLCAQLRGSPVRDEPLSARRGRRPVSDRGRCRLAGRTLQPDPVSVKALADGSLRLVR